MISLFDFFIGLLVFAGLGVAPVYLLIISLAKTERATALLIAFGFAPACIGLLNTFVVLLGIQHTAFQLAVPVLVWIGIIALILKRHTQQAILIEHDWWIPLIVGLVTGWGYWLIAFPPASPGTVSINFDVVWNLGLVGELKNHFPPKDPHWITAPFFVYHYVTTMYMAGVSNFGGLNMLATHSVTNLTTALSLFAIVVLWIPRSMTVEGIIIFTVALISSFSDGWTVFRAFHGHISGQAASTFFWSLPVFLASLRVWQLVDENRDQLRFRTIAVISFCNALMFFFAKTSYVTVFLFMELISFVKVFLHLRLWNISSIKIHYSLALTYLLYPVFCLLLALIIATSGVAVIFPGLEVRDFSQFGSWNPIYPFLAMYLTTLVFVLFRLRNLRTLRWDFLLCSLLNLGIFFVVRHEGYSDLYFAFNALLLNIIFILISPGQRKLVSYLAALLVCSVVLGYLVRQGKLQGFNSLQISFEKISPASNSNGSRPLEEIEEYMELAKPLPADAIIAAPQQEIERFFFYSAFIGRRIWNECPVYLAGTINGYLPYRLFLAQEKFVPSYFSKTPDEKDEEKAFNEFTKSLVIDTSRYMNPIDRYRVYNTCVFGDSPKEELESTAKKYDWTHIIVLNKDLSKINSWMRSLPRRDGKYISIFQCTSR